MLAPAMAAYWLAKTEPEEYSWDELVRKKRGRWDGVRNYVARNHLRAMKVDDLVLFYHSGTGREIVGIARVVREAYPDPTVKDVATADNAWSAVDVAPVKKLARSVTLTEIKADSTFADMLLVRQSRLSVMPVSPAHFRRILKLGQTRLD
jgi:predicted RNA-binding protein with PUA-like domain